MYRKEVIMLAKAVREAAAEAGVNGDVTRVLARHIAGVCEDRSPEGQFDEELFMAFALSPHA